MSDEPRVKKSEGDAASSMSIVEIAYAEPSDADEVTSLLEYYHLSTAGLGGHLATTLVARVDQHVVGSAALEVYSAAALLRSVAVAPHLHGRRLGERLTLAALDLARERGVEYVYLFAGSASDYFQRFGFTPISREELPLPLYLLAKQQPGRPAITPILAMRLSPLP